MSSGPNDFSLILLGAVLFQLDICSGFEQSRWCFFRDHWHHVVHSCPHSQSTGHLSGFLTSNTKWKLSHRSYGSLFSQQPKYQHSSFLSVQMTMNLSAEPTLAKDQMKESKYIGISESACTNLTSQRMAIAVTGNSVWTSICIQVSLMQSVLELLVS